MSDPRRLIDGSSSRLVTELLTAGRLEEPAPALVERFIRTAPLGLAVGVAVERLVSTTAGLEATGAVATGSAAAGPAAAGPAAAGPAAAGSAAAGSNLVAGGTAASAASLGGATAVTAGLPSGTGIGGALAQAGAVGVGMVKGGAAGTALVKSGTVAVALVKWVGLGVVGVAAVAGTPKLLRWVDQRDAGIGTATSAVVASRANQVALPRASTSSAAPSVEPAEPARAVESTRIAESTRVVEPARVVEAVEPTRVVEPGAAPRPERLARSAVEERTVRPKPLAPATPRQTSATVSAPSPQSHPRVVPSPSAPSAPSTPSDRRVAPAPASGQPPSMVPPSPARIESNADIAPIALPPSTLSSELASVDRARAALARGDARRTLHELAGHERRYPKGQLELEVCMLRMEAHVQRGDLPAARALAKRILAEHVSPLHARRARQVLEGQPSAR
jgi:hypothetical protein